MTGWNGVIHQAVSIEEYMRVCMSGYTGQEVCENFEDLFFKSGSFSISARFVPRDYGQITVGGKGKK